MQNVVARIGGAATEGVGGPGRPVYCAEMSALDRLRGLAAAATALASVSMVRAQDADERLAADVRHALDAARPALLAHLREAEDPFTRPGELALLALAAIHDGLEAGEPALDAALLRLAAAKPQETYDLALRLLVLEAWPAFPDRTELAAQDTKALLRHRDVRGGFGYGRKGKGWDLSNSQYAALGLRAGAALGAQVSKRVWKKLADEVGDQQHEDGGWTYSQRTRNTQAYASMTAAGIAVLAICRQPLDGAQREIDERIERGWRWFAGNKDRIGAAQERWSFYFHYGLERAAILTDVVEVAGESWYANGARMFVRLQDPGGGWRSEADAYSGRVLEGGRGDAVPTAFAVLFLRRKFRKDVGPTTPHVVRLVNLGPHSQQRDVDACAAQLVARGKEALPDVLGALRSDVVPQRRAAATALRELAGEAFGYDPEQGVAANREAIKAAELWFLKNR